MYRPLSRFPKFLFARDYARFCLAKTSLRRTRSAMHYGFDYHHTDQTNTPYAMRTGIRILKLVPDGVLCASQNFDRCHGSRNFCLLETTLVFALQKLRFGEPVVLCTTGSIIAIQTKQISRTRCVRDICLVCPMGFEPTTFRVGV